MHKNKIRDTHERPEERRERPDLERRYGSIGISAVAAASRYSGGERAQPEDGRGDPNSAAKRFDHND